MSEMIEEFERFFERGDQDECWPWKGRLQSNKSGMLYGYFKKGLRANRVAYKFYCGAIPPSAVVRHRCDNSICVNPRHLEIGTQKQNVHDRYERGRAIPLTELCTRPNMDGSMSEISMVERVAKAMVSLLRPDQAGCSPEQLRHVDVDLSDLDLIELARAAIEAMRTPTDEMVSLGVGAVKLAKNISHGADPSAVLKGRTVLAWQVMINAALSEKP